MSKRDIPRDELTSRLDYDPETGRFTWRHHAMNRPDTRGRIAGTTGARGYWVLTVRKHKLYAHQLAWLFMNGDWPKHDIDHINGEKLDNRIANLRDVDRSENMRNLRGPTKRSSLGILGVSPRRGKFEAQVMIRGTAHRLGSYATADLARAAYVASKQEAAGASP